MAEVFSAMAMLKRQYIILQNNVTRLMKREGALPRDINRKVVTNVKKEGGVPSTPKPVTYKGTAPSTKTTDNKESIEGGVPSTPTDKSRDKKEGEAPLTSTPKGMAPTGRVESKKAGELLTPRKGFAHNTTTTTVINKSEKDKDSTDSDSSGCSSSKNSMEEKEQFATQMAIEQSLKTFRNENIRREAEEKVNSLMDEEWTNGGFENNGKTRAKKKIEDMISEKEKLWKKRMKSDTEDIPENHYQQQFMELEADKKISQLLREMKKRDDMETLKQQKPPPKGGRRRGRGGK